MREPIRDLARLGHERGVAKLCLPPLAGRCLHKPTQVIRASCDLQAVATIEDTSNRACRSHSNLLGEIGSGYSKATF